MTRHLVVLAVAFILSACSGQDASPQASNGATQVVTDGPTTAAPASAAFAYSPFPQGVALAQDFHVRSDRIYTTKTGAQRRRATLELLEGGTAAAAENVQKQMAASGFRALPVKDKGDGITRLAFVKKGMGRTNVSVNPDVGDKPSNPHAVGVIMFDWQLTPMPASQVPVAKANSAGQDATATPAAAGG